MEVLSGGRWEGEPAASGADPQDIAEEADLAARVRRAVDNLPRGQRASVLLFYLSGLTYAETAAQLGIEVGAVKTRLNKARRALRRQMDEMWKEKTLETKPVEERGVLVRVADVRRRAAGGDKPAGYFVVLEEIDGGRRLPIWIGESEGISAALQLEKRQMPRPQTYAFTASLLQATGGRLREVVITKLDADVYYAVAVVESARKRGTVDARPSDAINLALLTGAPILVAPSVFEAAMVSPAKTPLEEGSVADETLGVKEIVAEVEASWVGPGTLTYQPI